MTNYDKLSVYRGKSGVGAGFLLHSCRTLPGETGKETGNECSLRSSFTFDGLFIPLTLRTNCKEALRISSCAVGGSKLYRVLMFRHMDQVTSLVRYSGLW
jgi:hypothetical protein